MRSYMHPDERGRSKVVNDATPNSPSMNNAPFCPLSQPRFSIPLPRSVSDSRAAAGSAFPSPSRLGRAPFSAPATGVQPASAAETRSSQLGTPEDGFGISGNAPRGEATLTVSQGNRREEERGGARPGCVSPAPSEEHSRLFMAVVGTAEPYLAVEDRSLQDGPGQREWGGVESKCQSKEQKGKAELRHDFGARRSTYMVRAARGMYCTVCQSRQ
jgi:hypothetical protein